MAIISADVFSIRDISGNVRTEAWILFEFDDAEYNTGGEIIDLSPYFRRVEHVLANPLSGAFDYVPRINAGDFPAGGANLGSGRLELLGVGSSSVTVNTSGVGVEVVSGTQVLVLSGDRLSPLFSGSMVAQATSFFPADGVFAEIASGIAVSGTRAKLHVLGY